MRSGWTLAIAAAVALSGWSCGSTAPDTTPEVAAIVVSPASSTIALNDRLSLQAEVQDGSGAILPGAAITWTVQDPSILGISSTGVVTALAVGTSRVAANALGKSGIATITVSAGAHAEPPAAPPPAAAPPAAAGATVASVRVSAPSKKVKVGNTMQLTATAIDSRGNTVPNQSFTWSSSNTNVATVSASGVASGKRKGSVTITAQTSQSGGKSGSVQIDVK
ncbi:MAG: Ig-like domain-containing protein [Gemmatimonadetes bacterium]|nr:Ig-like domain-containing protein [Gemmatimonadota bacterium]